MAVNTAVNKVVYGDNTIIDISDTTATADKILEGYTAYGADGQKITGTASLNIECATIDEINEMCDMLGLLGIILYNDDYEVAEEE